MTDHNVAYEICDNFKKLIHEMMGKEFAFKHRTENIVELLGPYNCFIYIKVSSVEPHWWGIRDNHLCRFKQSGKNWVVALLHDNPQTGYFLTSEDVNRLLSDDLSCSNGDYKIHKRELQSKAQFNSFDEFVNKLQDACKDVRK